MPLDRHAVRSRSPTAGSSHVLLSRQIGSTDLVDWVSSDWIRSVRVNNSNIEIISSFRNTAEIIEIEEAVIVTKLIESWFHVHLLI